MPTPAERNIEFLSVMSAVRFHVDAGNVKVAQLAIWCGQKERTVYNWLAGQSGPDSVEVNLWLQRLPENVRIDVASAQLAGSRLGIRTLDVDVDCAGKSNLSDSIDLNLLAAQFTKEVARAEADGSIDAAEAAALTRLKNEMVTRLEVIEQRNARRTLRRVG